MTNFNSILNEIILEKIYENLPGKKVRSSGGKINVRCWICGDSRKKISKRRGWFYTNNDPISYHCFNEGCTASGINLLASICSCSSKEASKMVFNRIRKFADKDTTMEDLQKVEATKRPEIIETEIITEEPLEIPNYWIDLNEDAKTILKNRKILQAPFMPPKWKLYYSTRHKRIAIPWVSNGKIDTYQYRAMYKNQDPKYIFKSGSSKSIFIDNKNLDDDFPYIFTHEGVFDSIWMINSCAVGGIIPTNDQIKELESSFPFYKIVYTFDNPWQDTASRDRIIKLGKENPKQLVFFWDKNNKSKDINEDILKSNNIQKYANKDFVKSHITTALKAKCSLLFNK
jgi:hypothetical protein